MRQLDLRVQCHITLFVSSSLNHVFYHFETNQVCWSHRMDWQTYSQGGSHSWCSRGCQVGHGSAYWFIESMKTGTYWYFRRLLLLLLLSSVLSIAKLLMLNTNPSFWFGCCTSLVHLCISKLLWKYTSTCFRKCNIANVGFSMWIEPL